MKKINRKDVAYIKGTKKTNFLLSLLFKWTLNENPVSESMFLYTQWRVWAIIIFSIPVILITLIYSLWDGGLKEGLNNIKDSFKKEYCFETKNYYSNGRYARMKKVFDNK